MQNNLEWIVFDLGGVVVNLDIEGVQKELARRSDTDRNVMLANYRSLRLFHRRIASHLIRAAKPEPEAFAIVCRELNATPAGCLLIDDALVNVNAARAVGWHAIHFRTAAGLRADLQTYGITV
jgi:FMN phosphatase YigB (HAD superfamily)